jgi:LmbE family N-acetylglucosaminyl deacetylase
VRAKVKRSARRAQGRNFWDVLWAWVGGGLLVATTTVWAYLGSQINLSNADQLVNVFLLDDSSGMQAAELPSQHTFLLKIPLLWLVHLLGSTSVAFTFVTMLTVLATIGGLMVVVHKIVRDPLRFGVVCMLLASLLLLVPAQPAPGVLLPVNMAMLTTRNIEYILFIGSIVLLAQKQAFSLRAWRFWAATAIATLLIASDKLFLPFYVGGAGLLLVVFALYRQRVVMAFAMRWLLCGIVSVALSMVGTAIIGAFVFHVVGSGVTPYALTLHGHALLVGAGYAVIGLLTNLGLNPSMGPLGVGNLIGQTLAQLVRWGGPAMVLNAFTVGVAAVFTGRFLARSRKLEEKDVAWPQLLFLGLLSATVIAILAFILTDHYYPVDARYLGIGFFAVAIGLALAVKEWKWFTTRRNVVLPILLVGVVSACALAVQMYQVDVAELAPILKHNKIAAAAVAQHHSPVLVGDYWRVVPAQLQGNNTFRALPLDNCTHFREVLSNAKLSSDFNKKQPFAYLLSFDNHSPDFPNCTLDEVVAAFGQPNKSVVIDGSRDNPKELLLFYDGGIQPVATGGKETLATILPVGIDELAVPSCHGGHTIVSVVAHQDDDLLFMNPDHMHALRAGDCIRSIYLTAGDAGGAQLYWIGREKGSEAAYDIMLGGKKHVWNDQVVRLSNGAYLIIATPDDTSQVSLIFMRLPDGNTNGSGFKATDFQSLSKLQAGKIPNIRTVNKQSSYTKDELSGSLKRLMETYNPDEVDTQAPLNLSKRYVDHSDHILTAQFTRSAFEQYQANNPNSTIKYYTGYPIHGDPPNVFGEDYQTKGTVFFTYAKYDSGACTTFASCSNHSVYGEYLRRQYQYKPTH